MMRKRQVDEMLNPCTLVKPGNVNSVENKDGWMKIKFMVPTYESCVKADKAAPPPPDPEEMARAVTPYEERNSGQKLQMR